MPVSEYDVDFFIKKFDAIPEEQWCTEEFTDVSGACCVYGHCGLSWGRPSHMSDMLEDIFMVAFGVDAAYVNDCRPGDDPRFQELTPKQRVLAALYKIKEQL